MDPNRPDESFTKVAIDNGMKPKTLDVLLAEDYDARYVLSIMEERDLESLDITRGQKSMLRNWVKTLKSSMPRTQLVTTVEDQNNTFGTLAKAQGIKQKTLEVLLEEDYDSLYALSHMEEKDLEEITISRGQKSLLRQWVKELKAHAPRLKVVADPEPASASRQNSEQKISKPRLVGSATLKLPSKQKKHSRKGSLPGTLGKVTQSSGDNGATNFDPMSERMPGDGGDPDNLVLQSEGDGTKQNSLDLVITPENIDDCLRELQLNESAQAEVRQHVLENGVDGLDSCLMDKLADFMKCPVSIAITGRSGTGKSSLANSLRKVKPRTENAAPTGNTETTMEITPYEFPQMENTKLWDLPGVNTPNFPKETYLEKVKFKSYDAVIIVASERFTEDDLWLAQEAHQDNKPFFYLRTKIDLDIQNSRENDGIDDETIVLDKIRKQIIGSFDKAKLPSDRVFLISNVYGNQTRWDYPKLIRDLLDKAPERNKYAMVMAMVSCSKDVILMKEQELKNRIDMVVLGTLIKGKNYDKVLQQEIRLYTERLGITEADLKDVDTDNFSSRIHDIIEILKQILCHPVEECTTGRKVGIWFFGLGYFIGKWIDISRTNEKRRRVKMKRDEVIQEAKVILTTVLDKCVELALAVLDAQKYLDAK